MRNASVDKLEEIKQDPVQIQIENAPYGNVNPINRHQSQNNFVHKISG